MRKLKENYFPAVEIKDYNIMIDRKKFIDQPVKNDLKTYNKITKIGTGQGEDFTTGCLLGKCYKYNKLIAKIITNKTTNNINKINTTK